MPASAAEIVAYERAARAVFTPLQGLVERREQRRAAGSPPDGVPAATQLAEMAVWAAAICYLISDAVVAAFSGVEAVEAAAPVADWVLAMLRAVEDWTLASTDPARMQTMRLPATPPAPPTGAGGEPLARAAVAVLRALHAQVAGDLASLRARLEVTDARLATAAERVAYAGAVVQFASPLVDGSGPISEQASDGILSRSIPAITAVFQTGQAVAAPLLFDDLAASPMSAMPASADVGSSTAASGGSAVSGQAVRRWAELGSADFDRWCLTDPHSRLRLRSPERAAALDGLWRLPGAATLVPLQNLLEESLARGEVSYARSGHGRYAGHFHRVPWAPVYEAVRALRLGPLRLQAGDTFTLQTGELDPEPALPRITVDVYSDAGDGTRRGTLARTVPAPGPGDSGFDPWVATDPHVRVALSRLASSAALLDGVWDSAGARDLLGTLDEIAVLAAHGGLEAARNENGTWRAPLRRPPWPTVWVARRPVHLGGQDIRAGGEIAAASGGGLELGPFSARQLLPLPPTEAALTGADSSPDAPAAAAAPPSPLPVPGESGFDPWQLTDPHQRSSLRAAGRLAEVEAFWASLDAPTSARLRGAGAVLQARLADGSLEATRDDRGRWAPCLPVVPFAAVLTATRALEVAGVAVPAGARIALDARSPSGVSLGPFSAGAQPAPVDAAAPPHPAEPTAAPAPPPDEAAGPERFDLETHRWALTDPHARSRLRRDPATVARIDAFWAVDDDPDASLAAGREVDEAIRRGDLAYATARSGAWAQPVDVPPYCAQLVAHRPVTLLGTALLEGQVTALEVVRESEGAVRRRMRRSAAQP